MEPIYIKEPRYHDRVVLVGKYRLYGKDDVVIHIGHGAYKGKYPARVSEIREFPLGTNGKISCYEVPLEWLTGGNRDVAMQMRKLEI